MADIEKIISATMENLKGMIDVNTIVGDAVSTPEGTTVIPVSKVSFGFASGGADFISGREASDSNAFGGGAGGGVTIKPVAFLVMEKDHVKLMPVSPSVSTVDKIIDTVPELMAKFNSFLSTMSDKKKNKSCEKSEDIDIVLEDDE